MNLHKKVRVECAVNDDYVDTTIEGIVEGARTGEIGDGKARGQPVATVKGHPIRQCRWQVERGQDVDRIGQGFASN